MRKLLSFLVFSLMLLASSPMAFAAKDKKDDKGKPDKGQEPIVITIFVWNGAWSPVMRVAQTDNPSNTFLVTEESIEIL